MTDKAKFTNTLTRWHKVVERANEALGERQSEMAQLMGPRSCSAEDFEAVALKAAKDAVKFERLMEEAKAISESICSIRSALGKANAEFGVSDLLAQVERNRREIALFGGFSASRFDDADGAREVAMKKLSTAAELLSSASVNAVELSRREKSEKINFCLLSDAMRETFARRAKELKGEIISLSDKISNANASKLSIELETGAATILMLS